MKNQKKILKIALIGAIIVGALSIPKDIYAATNSQPLSSESEIVREPLNSSSLNQDNRVVHRVRGGEGSTNEHFRTESHANESLPNHEGNHEGNHSSHGGKNCSTSIGRRFSKWKHSF